MQFRPFRYAPIAATLLAWACDRPAAVDGSQDTDPIPLLEWAAATCRLHQSGIMYLDVEATTSDRCSSVMCVLTQGDVSKEVELDQTNQNEWSTSFEPHTELFACEQDLRISVDCEAVAYSDPATEGVISHD